MSDAQPARNRFSLIIPVYRNESTIADLIAATEQLSRQLADRFHVELEVVLVVDGSPDRSFERLQTGLAQASVTSQLLLLSRNFGAFIAIRTGLQYAQGTHFAVMAADLQEPPELILKFYEILAADQADIVVGQRTGRHDPWTTRLPSACFWWSYRQLVQPEMPPGGVDVFACNQHVRDALMQMAESHTSLVGLLYWLGFRRASVPYVRQERRAGKSAWTFRKKWQYMLNSIFSFTALPISVLGFVGVLGVLSSLLISVIVFVSWYMNWIPVPGYTPLMLVILLSSSAQLIGLSIVGNYVWRAYENSKHRPLAIVMRQFTFRPLP
jgi:glycosyltransferase involved in cell wall biosynthesis